MRMWPFSHIIKSLLQNVIFGNSSTNAAHKNGKGFETTEHNTIFFEF